MSSTDVFLDPPGASGNAEYKAAKADFENLMGVNKRIKWDKQKGTYLFFSDRLG
jgi:hypothetical protein